MDASIWPATWTVAAVQGHEDLYCLRVEEDDGNLVPSGARLYYKREQLHVFAAALHQVCVQMAALELDQALEQPSRDAHDDVPF